jgi:putative IMPACT (imprinted ancient) family translation regulator
MKFDKTNEIVEKKSKFYGYLLSCTSEDEIKNALEFLKKEHKKATHICWAGRMKSPFFEKAVDDGEPSGTAGRPILGVMQKKDVQNAAVFIVRYFGGVKIGAGGLVRIYAKTTADLLS